MKYLLILFVMAVSSIGLAVFADEFGIFQIQKEIILDAEEKNFMQDKIYNMEMSDIDCTEGKFHIYKDGFVNKDIKINCIKSDKVEYTTEELEIIRLEKTKDQIKAICQIRPHLCNITIEPEAKTKKLENVIIKVEGYTPPKIEEIVDDQK